MEKQSQVDKWRKQNCYQQVSFSAPWPLVISQPVSNRTECWNTAGVATTYYFQTKPLLLVDMSPDPLSKVIHMVIRSWKRQNEGQEKNLEKETWTQHWPLGEPLFGQIQKKLFKSVIQFHFLTLLHYEKRCITKDTFYKKATKQGLK